MAEMSDDKSFFLLDDDEEVGGGGGICVRDKKCEEVAVAAVLFFKL